jgi:hypothetical protein
MAVIATPKFKRSVEFCGMAGPVDGVGDGQTCHRLPAHHGEHSAFVRGNGVAKKVAAKRATRKVVTRTVNGTKYRQTIGKDGVITLRPIAAVTPEPVAAPTKSATKVRVIPMAKRASRRRVAGPANITRRPRTAKPSGRPSARLA